MDESIDSPNSPELLRSLTETQQQAVCHVDGPLLILAGPGSGKTRVVTHRVAYLLEQGVPPQNVLALTFTNKAADEMQLRLGRLAPGQRVWMGTFHRFCARLLRRFASMVGLSENYTIYDMDDAKRAMKEAIARSHLDLSHYTPDQVARGISWAKNQLITAEDYEPNAGNPLGSIVAEIYPLYQQVLLGANAVDFDDLLVHVAVMLREQPELRMELDARYRYILVDEYQDTNLAQYAIVRALSVDHPNLAVTGDPDQSIYGWRGASLDNILEFKNDFPAVNIVRLEQNYRSTKSILRVADQLIANNMRRLEKELFTQNPEGKPVRLTAYPSQRDEADHIAATIAHAIHHEGRRPRDFAIFYRINALSRSLEHALREERIPYIILNGQEFYQRKEIKDLLAYLHLLNNPRDDIACLRVINTPPRGIGKKTIDRLNEHARRYRIPILDAAREAGLIDSIPKRSAVAVAKFVAMMDRLSVSVIAPVEEILSQVLDDSGYRDRLESSEAEEDEDRLANIDELLNAAREFDQAHPEDGGLEAYLEQTALVSDTDAWEDESDCVTLMTLHSAKGLEFPVAFIVALEKEILPHKRSSDDPERLEEERRLLFVGITRAEEELYLSYAQYRSLRGEMWPTIPSDFLMELPREEMEVQEPTGYHLPDDEHPDGHDEVHESWNQDVWPDDEYSQDEPSTSISSVVDGLSGAIRTAAEMISDSEPAMERLPPDAFEQGMVVTHPQHGLGKITAVSGVGRKRRAVVKFVSTNDEHKFVLAFSELRPVNVQS